MNINVPAFARAHFWNESSKDSIEFWAFRFKPVCQMGDELIFRFDGQAVARAKVAWVESPGKSKCRQTGKYENRWKVFWNHDSFEDLRISAEVISPGPLFATNPRQPSPETPRKQKRANP